MRISKLQLQTLVILASPTMSMVVPGKTERAMISRGLLKCHKTGGFACITPFGLRVLADEMEAGRVDDALARIDNKMGQSVVNDAGKIATTLSFLTSVIKSGEAWSPTCGRMVLEAYDALYRITPESCPACGRRG